MEEEVDNGDITLQSDNLIRSQMLTEPVKYEPYWAVYRGVGKSSVNTMRDKPDTYHKHALHSYNYMNTNK